MSLFALACLTGCSDHADPSGTFPEGGTSDARPDADSGSNMLAQVPFVVEIAIDVRAVYYATDSQLVAVPLDGSGAFVLASDVGPMQIAVANDFVYWVSRGDIAPDGSKPQGAVRRVSVHGGAPETLVDNQISAEGVAVDESYVYWTAYVPKFGLSYVSTLRGKPLQGGPIVDVLPNVRVMAPCIAAHDGTIVVATEHPSVASVIVRITRNTWESRGLSGTQRVARSIAFDETDAYWISPSSTSPDGPLRDGELLAVDLDPDGYTGLVHDLPVPQKLFVSKGEIFWSNMGQRPPLGAAQNGGVWRMIRYGLGPTAIVSGRDTVLALAVDDAHIAWVETVPGVVDTANLFVQPR